MRHTTRIACLVFLAIVILLNLPRSVSMRLKAGAHDNVAPFQNMVSFIMNKWRANMQVLIDARGVVAERKKMQEEVADLKHKVKAMESLELDNDALRKQLEFKKRQGMKMILCEVIMRGDMSGWWQTVTLNRGTDDGVFSDMAVVTVDGLIGRTTAVSRHTAEVLLVTDPNCKVACRLARAGAFGIVSGQGVRASGVDRSLEMFYGPQPFYMDYISKGQDVYEGDDVVTSGLGGVYPEGLFVGKVARIEEHSSRLYYVADVLPVANIASLKYAFVVQKVE